MNDRRFPTPLTVTVVVALFTALAPGCEEEVPTTVPMEPVPLSPAAARAPAGPLPSGAATANLPADHPPIPGASGTPSGLPPDHPPIGGGAAAPFAGAAMDAGGLRWQAPATWVEEPPASSMRLTQWRLGVGAAAGPAECALLRFSGGGSVEDNLARWTGQFTQPDGSPTAEHAETFQAEVGALRVTRLELTGTYNASMGPMGPMAGGGQPLPDYALFAAVLEGPQGMYFLKCTGPASTMTAEHPGLVSLLESFSL